MAGGLAGAVVALEPPQAVAALDGRRRTCKLATRERACQLHRMRLQSGFWVGQAGPSLAGVMGNFRRFPHPKNQRRRPSASPNAIGRHAEPEKAQKGWGDARLLAQLRSLAVIADDRAEMHRAVAMQRDNWGRLIQVTVTMSLISAGMLSALNTREAAAASFSLALTAALLSAVAAVFMALESWFQPSQLAEEQRAATRFFRMLVKEIQGSLHRGGTHLQEEATLFYNAKLARLRCLDTAFPLPLFPGGTDKFPAEVKPSVLTTKVDEGLPEIAPASPEADNGWTPQVVEDLKRTAALLKNGDIEDYVGKAGLLERVNKVLAISGPLLAVVSVVTSFMGRNGSLVASACSVLAAICSSLAHDGQVGMIFEMYREVAGNYEEIRQEILRNLRLPVRDRQDGELFHQKVAFQLGVEEGKGIVRSSDQKAAGTLL